MCTSIHINFWYINPLLRGSGPPRPLALLTLTRLAFVLVMFTPGIMSVFYLNLFPAVFSDIHPGHNRKAQD